MAHQYSWVLSKDVESDDPPRKAIVLEEGIEWSHIQWKDTAQNEHVLTTRILSQKGAAQASVSSKAEACADRKRNVETEEMDLKPRATQTKRPKINENNGISTESSQTLLAMLPCEELMILVVPFLGPRELLNFVCTSKFFLSKLSHELVIRSAVLFNSLQSTKRKDTPANRMKQIASLLKKGLIHIPTPVRLLRLMLGTRCEQSGCLTECTMRKGFALFMCARCRRIGPLHSSNSSVRSRLLYYRATEKFRALWDYESSGGSIINEPYIAPRTGEAAGPFYTVLLLHQLKDADAGHDDETKEQIWQLLNRPSMEEYNRISAVYESAVTAVATRKRRKGKRS